MENSAEESVLHIERIVSGGDGLARRPDGCVVFAARTAPGDVVEVAYTETHRQWRRGRVARVVAPGPDRRDPPCRYYGRCGGCQLQHMEYPAQLRAKAAVVTDCLRRMGGVTVDDVEIEPSPREWAYRNRVSLAVRGSGSSVVLGYHAFDDPDDIVDITECPLAEPPINDALKALRPVLPELVRRRDTRLTIRATSEGRIGLVIEDGGSTTSDVPIPGIDAVWRVDSSGQVTSGSGAEKLKERWGSWEIAVSAATFLQVNREAAEKLDAYVIERCGRGHKIVDAYCGFGLRALELARRGAEVTGLDIDRRSITVASELATAAGLPARFRATAVERGLSRALPADLVVLNPPRRGVARPVIGALLRQAPARIVYVSCDPATLARDIKRLQSQYGVDDCRSFDLFPQTAHVETVATLIRRSNGTAMASSDS